jgi:hypothetical protein
MFISSSLKSNGFHIVSDCCPERQAASPSAAQGCLLQVVRQKIVLKIFYPHHDA